MSGADAEAPLDEPHLTNDVGLGQPADLSLPDDVHCFVSGDRVQRAIHRSEPLTGRDAFLYEPVILLQDVAHVR